MSLKYLWIPLAVLPASCGAQSSRDKRTEQTDSSPGISPTAARSPPQQERENMHDAPDDRGRIRLGRTDKFRVSAASRISVEAQFDTDMAAALHLPEGSERSYANRVSDACVRILRSTDRPASIIASPGQIIDDGTNILVRLTITPNSKGYPYRVSLVASQGAARWAASIERPTFRYIPDNIPIRPDNTTQDGRRYWDAARDTNMLAERLCDHLF